MFDTQSFPIICILWLLFTSLSHPSLTATSLDHGPFSGLFLLNLMQKPTSLAQAAQTGFASSAAYDAHRPTYSPEAVEELLTRLEVSGVAGAKILDLAAGTGKFTEVLAARPEGYEITAVEPHDGMRQELERKQVNAVRVYKGTADAMPDVADTSMTAVIAAQVGRRR